MKTYPGQVQRTCLNCQSEFWSYPSKKGNYCSIDCKHQGWGKRFSERQLKPRTDPQNCSKCGTSYPLVEYPKRDGIPGLRCKQCVQPSPEQKRKSHLWVRFKITLDAWIDIYNNQNGQCPICNKPLPTLDQMFVVMERKDGWNSRDWNTDHCHETNRVRGILHRKCNMGIGSIGDNIENLKRSIQYLEQHCASCKHT